MLQSLTIPPRLVNGDKLRVIAPARSFSILSSEVINSAQSYLENLGFQIEFGKNIYQMNSLNSSSAQNRADDLNEAFADHSVKGVITAIGGYNTNQILEFLDFELIQNNPKVFCGYSNITCIQVAIARMSGLVTYYGPHFSTFARIAGREYVENAFSLATMTNGEFELKSSGFWFDDLWYEGIQNEIQRLNSGPWIIQERAELIEGILIGGNLFSLQSIFGTNYVSFDQDIILCIEDTFLIGPDHFEMLLQSVTMQSWFKYVKGILVGRFQVDSKVDRELLTEIIALNHNLAGITVVSNLDFGHTSPINCLPLGSLTRIIINNSNVRICLNCN